jgi:hypothetical protein
MRTALAFWRRGPATATSSTLVLHRPAEINWLHVIAPVIAVACLGIAGWHFKSGRGYMGWGVTGVALMVISGLGRMAEGFITQAQGIQEGEPDACAANSFSTCCNCCSIWRFPRRSALCQRLAAALASGSA